MMRQFETPGAVRLFVRNASGEIGIATHRMATTEVGIRALTPASEEQAALTRVECTEESGEYRVLVDVPSPHRGLWLGDHGVEVLVKVPEGAWLDLTGSSADVVAEGRFAGGKIQTASGDIRLEHASGDLAVATASGDVTVYRAEAALKVRSAKGDISVHRAFGQLTLESESGDIDVDSIELGGRLRAASGDIQVGRMAGMLEAGTSSGDVTVREAYGDCRLGSRSGDLEIESVRAGKVLVETMSGDVTVGVSPGSRVSVDTQTRTGDLQSDIPLSSEPEPDNAEDASPLVTLQIRTLTGDVSITRGRLLSANPG